VSFDAEGIYGSNSNGRLTLADGSPCGTINDFFGITVTATASLVVDGVATGPVRSNLDFTSSYAPGYAGSLSLKPDSLPPPNLTQVATVTAQCEGATLTYTSPIYNVGGQFMNSMPPSITDLSVTMNGRTVGSMVVNDLAPGSVFASHKLPSRDAFFTEMGVDSRLSACRYYEAIGVGTCDTQTQTLKDAINFEGWKRATGMAPYAREGHHEVTAAFVNKMDLNLARNHHSISYAPDHTAAYVCNGSGPPFTAVDGDADVTNAVANAVAGLNRIACVAMDYTRSPGVNGDAPFTRFIIFGPDGGVLPSINLDGRAEKFVPGVCVACHGGSNYAGHFPEDGSGLPDLGAHFLPYDAGNFLFSSAKGYRKEDQEAAIKQLNLIVLNGSGPPIGESNLIYGWYGQDLSAATLKRDYIPADWDAQEGPGGTIHQTYHQIIAPMCRTCHAALPERFNLDDYYALPTLTMPVDPQLIHDHDLCAFYQSMPNSLVTFNRFWTTFGAPNDPSGRINDLSTLWVKFQAANFNDIGGSCGPP
jgi:hypothetical protein